MRAKPWEVPDGLWERIEPLLPRKPRRFRYPGRKPFDDRLALKGILFVLHTGIGWEHLPQELGFGCGMTAWRAVVSAETANGPVLRELQRREQCRPHGRLDLEPVRRLRRRREHWSTQHRRVAMRETADRPDDTRS